MKEKIAVIITEESIYSNTLIKKCLEAKNKFNVNSIIPLHVNNKFLVSENLIYKNNRSICQQFKFIDEAFFINNFNILEGLAEINKKFDIIGIFADKTNYSLIETQLKSNNINISTSYSDYTNKTNIWESILEDNFERFEQSVPKNTTIHWSRFKKQVEENDNFILTVAQQSHINKIGKLNETINSTIKLHRKTNNPEYLKMIKLMTLEHAKLVNKNKCTV